MRASKIIFLSILFVAEVFNAFAQSPAPDNDQVKLYYRSEYVFGAFLHTRGFGAYARYAQNVTGFSQVVYGFELSNMRHPKQQRISNSFYEDAKGYYYGKLNSLTVTRFNIGWQKVLYGKELDKGVKISYLTQLGPTIGWVAPVYLEIEDRNTQDRSVERYDPEEHGQEDIIGRASFIHGVQNLSLYPGGHAKLAMNFEYSPLDESVKALEVGITLDGYLEEVPIMANTDNYQFWTTFYVSFHFGKKLY